MDPMDAGLIFFKFHTMHKLSYDRRSWIVDGQRKFIISGEIHYFRVRQADWQDRLQALKDAGGNCVATYVPWLLHEPKEGSFDFTTYPLEAFLDACAKAELMVVVRPGPYQYTELAYDGLPGWLCEGMPELRARRLDGKDFRVSSISYLHPGFLSRAKNWYDAVLPRIIPYLSSRGGPVVSLQVDNELMGVHEWQGTWDYHPEAMGVGREDGRWPDWLRTRHGNLEAANGAYGTVAINWSQLLPIQTVVDGSLGQRRLVRDYQEFYFETIGEYAATLAGWMRAAGISEPIVHNSGNPYMNAYFSKMVRRLGPGFSLGSDHYYNLDLDWDQNHPTPQYASKCAYSLGQLREMGSPPTVWEMPGGSLSDWPPITPGDGLAAWMTNLAYGMKGVNYYIFAGGPNPPGAGTTSDNYDYGAAVDAITGERRPLWHAQRAFHSLLHRESWLADAHIVADCRIALCDEYANSNRYGKDTKELGFAPAEAWEFTRKGLFITASCAGLSPDFVSLDGESDLPTNLPILVATGCSMPASIQLQLVRFLNAGGRLLLAPVIPVLDEQFLPCRLLADRLGAAGDGVLFGTKLRTRLNAHQVSNVSINGALYGAGALPLGAHVTAREEFSDQPVGWHLPLTRGGAVTLLGLKWRHSKREHEQMLNNALAQLGLRRTLSQGNPNIWAVLRSDGQRSCLFLLNLFTTASTTRITFTDPGSGRIHDTGPVTIPGATVAVWTQEFGLWSGLEPS